LDGGISIHQIIPLDPVGLLDPVADFSPPRGLRSRETCVLTVVWQAASGKE
jgi:hypothetical protein